MPLGSFPGVSYDELTLPLHRDDVVVFCTDGIFEAENEVGEDFGAQRLCSVVREHRAEPARAIVDAIFDDVADFTGGGAHVDDMTAVAVKIIT